MRNNKNNLVIKTKENAIEIALENFLYWFSSGKYTINTSDFETMKNILSGLKFEDYGELIAFSFLKNEGFKMLFANVHMKTSPGDSVSNVDIFCSKNEIKYFSEVKTTPKNYDGMKTKVLNQIKGRLDDYPANIHKLKLNDINKNTTKRESLSGQGLIITNKLSYNKDDIERMSNHLSEYQLHTILVEDLKWTHQEFSKKWQKTVATVEEAIIQKLNPDGSLTKIDYDATIASMQRDLNYKKYPDTGLFKILKHLSKEDDTFFGKKLSLNQKLFVEKMEDKNTPEILLIAKTGYGKTFLTSIFFAHKQAEVEQRKLSIKFNYIHIVPNDILVTQIIYDVKNNIKSENVNVSEEYIDGESNYLVMTPEKFFGMKGVFEERISIWNKIIIDEAHIVLNDDDARASFMQYVISMIIKKNKSEYEASFQIIYLTPFISGDGIFEFQKRIKCDKNIEIFNGKGYSSTYVIQNLNKEKSWFLQNYEIQLNDFVQEEGITLNFFTSKSSARSAYKQFAYFSRNEKYEGENANRISKNTFLNDFYNQLRKKPYYGRDELDSYDVGFNLIKGIALYHSDMPNFIKEIIFAFAKNGCIHTIFATNAIVNGADLRIKEVIINSVIRKRKRIEVNEFLNLAGRCGRYESNKNQILGLVKFNTKDNSKQIKDWFDANIEKLISRSSKTETNSKILNNTQKTMELLNGEIDNSLMSFIIADPRVNPDVSIFFRENIDAAKLVVSKTLFLLSNTDFMKNEKNEHSESYNNKLKFVSSIFECYFPNGKLKGFWKYSEITPMSFRKIKALKYFLWYIRIFNEEQLIMQLYNSNRHNRDVEFEDRISIFKKQSKYEIALIINHILEMGKQHNLFKFNLFDILAFRTTDFNLINTIITNNDHFKVLKHINSIMNSEADKKMEKINDYYSTYKQGKEIHEINDTLDFKNAFDYFLSNNNK